MITRIVNIVICYENEDEVLTYAKQLERQTYCEKIELCVVINKSKRGIEYLKNALKKLELCYTIVNPEQNLGYLNGLLYGYRKLNRDYEWYALSNTDIKIPDKRFFEEFFNKKYVEDIRVWATGPSIYAPKKNGYSNPYLKKRPTRQNYIIKNLGMHFPNIYEFLFHLKSNVRNDGFVKKPEQSCSTYAIHGSFMFLRRELLNALIVRSNWELLYDEEQYIAEIVQSNNKIELFDPNLQVLHMEGASTGKIDIKNRYARMRNSNERILKEFY